MASLAIEALPVHSAAAVLLAATSKSPTRAATTEVSDDDLLRLPLIDVAFFVQRSRTDQPGEVGVEVACRAAPFNKRGHDAEHAGSSPNGPEPL